MKNSLEIEKRIESHIESRKTYWNGLFLLTAGLATLTFNLDSLIKLILAILGILVWFIFVIIIYNINTELEILYNKLKD